MKALNTAKVIFRVMGFSAKKIGMTSLLISVFLMGGFISSANAIDIKTWQKKIGKLVAKKQVYPRSAMRKELEGRAKVQIVIDRTGKITSFAITQSTGHAVLDKAVPKLIKRIDPLPAPPETFTDSQLSFTLPLSWIIN